MKTRLNALTDFTPELFNPTVTNTLSEPSNWQPAITGLAYMAAIIALPVAALGLDWVLQRRRKAYLRHAQSRIESLIAEKRYSDIAGQLKDLCFQHWAHPEIMYMNAVQLSDFLYTQQGNDALSDRVCEWVFSASRRPVIAGDQQVCDDLVQWLKKL